MLLAVAKFVTRVVSTALLVRSGPSHPSGNELFERFIERATAIERPKVLELGTKRMIESVKTKHDDWLPNAERFDGFDIQEGIDADIVGDVHRLSEIVGAETYDVVISCSSFEHFKYPQLAAHEIMKTLKIGGLLFIQTHQSYPIHGVPNDYYRFSRDALAALFGTKMGFDVIATDYEFPVRIFTPETPSALMKAYMNTRLFGEKLAPTPEEYLYEF